MKAPSNLDVLQRNAKRDTEKSKTLKIDVLSLLPYTTRRGIPLRGAIDTCARGRVPWPSPTKSERKIEVEERCTKYRLWGR